MQEGYFQMKLILEAILADVTPLTMQNLYREPITGGGLHLQSFLPLIFLFFELRDEILFCKIFLK